MAVCLACGTWGTGPLCTPCSGTLVRASPRRLSAGVLVRPVWIHHRAARALVHRLKYQGVAGVADLVAPRLADVLPGGTDALVPVPRAWARRVRYGIDPARQLAVALGRITGLPVVPALCAPGWSRPLAAVPRRLRNPPRFRSRLRIPPRAVLVDDVLTTGLTLSAAAEALRGRTRLAIVATTAGRVPSEEEPPSEETRHPRDGTAVTTQVAWPLPG